MTSTTPEPTPSPVASSPVAASVSSAGHDGATTGQVDVVVIGGGFAGLAAAHRLRDQGLSVRVLEARDRVGGRTMTEQTEHGAVDLGGQWLGPGQTRMYELVAQLGAETYPMNVRGASVLHVDGRRTTYPGVIPRVPRPWGLGVLGLTMARVNRMAATIDVNRPWACRHAEQWDRQTLGDWLHRNVPSRWARELLEIAITSVMAVPPAEISLLHALFYVASAGSLELLVESEGGAQQDRVVGGMQSLAERFAAGLGDALVLGAPVAAVEEDGAGVVVHGAGGAGWRCRRVVCTAPPPLVRALTFSRPLSPARRALLERLPMGSAMKCFALYREPFWRAAGLSGQAVINEWPVRTLFDASGAGDRPAALMGFAEGNDARTLAGLPEAERRAAVVAAFVKVYGEAAAHPIGYLDRYWGDEAWSGGCYAAVRPPGTWVGFGNLLAEPHGAVHFAGTETATVWHGYIEGAVRSGERAADEALAALRRS